MRPTIIAGTPGSGKTTYLLNKVEEILASGVPPEKIGYVSFTRRAAQEASERAQKRFGFPKNRLPWFRTLHSLCFAALGLTSSDVMDGKKLKEFGEWVGIRISGNFSLEDGTPSGFDMGDRCLFMDNLARVRGINIEQQYKNDTDNLPWFWVERVTKGLATYKSNHHLLDFTDMLVLFAESDWRVKLDYLFVDEAQDLSLLQWRVVEKLAQGCREVVVAGDDDQCIYRWAGAAVEHFIGLSGNVTVLDQSWRVPSAPRAVAQNLLGRIAGRREKSWRPKVGEPGSVGLAARLEEVNFKLDEETLILARNTCFIKNDVIPFLEHAGIYYEYHGSPSVRPSIVRAVKAWEALRAGGTISAGDARLVYELLKVGDQFIRGNKKLPAFPNDDEQVSVQQLVEKGGLLAKMDIWHEALLRIPLDQRINMVKMLKSGQHITATPRVRVSTIHGSKGGEADHVVVLTDMASRTAREAEHNSEDEARCWYVATTRTRRDLTILKPQSRRAYTI